MIFNITKKELTVRKEMFSQTVEQPVDSEYLIPDYCPDIARILKCKGTAKIVTRVLNAGVLTLGGTVTVNLIYIDADEGGVKSYQTVTNFTREIQTGEECDGGDVYVQCGVDYMNCRMATSRKFDIHGAVSIIIRIMKNCTEKIVTGATDKHIQTLVSKSECTRVISVTERNLSISEEVEAGPGLAGLRSIIRSDACALFSECKAVTNKAIVKGDLNIRLLCCCAKNELKKHELSIPFSQVLDAPGIDEECCCDVSLDVSSLEARTRTGMDGECRSVTVSANILICLTVIKNSNEMTVTDAFSTEFDTDVRTADIVLRSRCGQIRESFVSVNRVDFPEAVVSVADIWCEAKQESCRLENGILTVSGTVFAEILAFNQDATPVYIEKVFEFTHDFKTEDADGNIDLIPKLQTVACAYTLTDASSAEIRTEILASMPVYTTKSICAVTDIVSESDRKKESDKDISLVVYFAHKGESLWELSRRYNTSAQAITLTNELKDEVLETDRMLLIPIV